MIRSATTWRGRPALHLTGDGLEAVVSLTGAQLACIRRPGDALNPLWQPTWTTADDPLLAVIVGSNPCIDRFGPPWPGEHKPVHGEAGVRQWSTSQEGDEAVFRTTLPQAALAVERRFRLVGDRLELTTDVRPLAGQQPRAIEWCEHTTLGDPFMDGAQITAGITSVEPMPGEAPGPCTVAAALAFPPAGAPARGDIYTAPVQQGWYRATNPRLGRTLEVTWDPAAFPWLCLWTQHCTRLAPPWSGRERARGMEVSTKPFPEGKPPASRAQTWLGRPTTCVVPASKRITFRWC